MDQNVLWHIAALIFNTAKALESNKFSVITASNRAESLEKILKLIGKSDIVAFGGSQTVKELALIEKLQERNQKILLEQPGMNRDEVINLRRKALSADIFIASPNAVTLDGSLFFVDKIGNRVGGMTFGPKKIIAIAGINKIVEDEPAALNRVRTKAGPVNSKRLKLNTPCAKSGLCSDCSSEDRICNIYLTLRKKPSYTDYYVVLVAEEFGY